MKHLLILLATISILFGCKENSLQDNLYRFDHPIDTNFRKEIPGTGYSYKSDKYKEDQLRLENIESGFETLQIRLWVDYALYKGRELYVIKNSNSKWTAEVYKMMTERSFQNQDSIVSKEIKSVIPKSGWDSLFTNLLNLKIETLPNMDDIPGLVNGWEDGVDFNIEIATKYSYRYYGYHVPKEFQDKFWEAKNMTQIVNIIRGELNQ